MIGAVKVIGHLLKNTPAISAQVSAANIWHGEIPQDNTADIKVRYYVVESEYATTKAKRATVDTFWVQIDVFAESMNKAMLAGMAIRSHLDKHTTGLIGGAWLDGISIEEEVLSPDLLFDRDVSRYSVEFKVRIINLGMNYSLTEQDTGFTWLNGETIYRQTYDIGTASGTAFDTTIPKTYSLIGLAEVIGLDSGGEPFLINPGMDVGATYWNIVDDLGAGNTQVYLTVQYIKSVLT